MAEIRQLRARLTERLRAAYERDMHRRAHLRRKREAMGLTSDNGDPWSRERMLASRKRRNRAARKVAKQARKVNRA